jgi:hypothetical protein
MKIAPTIWIMVSWPWAMVRRKPKVTTKRGLITFWSGTVGVPRGVIPAILKWPRCLLLSMVHVVFLPLPLDPPCAMMNEGMTTSEGIRKSVVHQKFIFIVADAGLPRICTQFSYFVEIHSIVTCVNQKVLCTTRVSIVVFPHNARLLERRKRVQCNKKPLPDTYRIPYIYIYIYIWS